MELINSHNDMVTTSSCSGRLSVFIEGTKSHNGLQKSGGKGEGGRWLYVTHDVNEVRGWLDKINPDSFTFAQEDFTHLIGDSVSGKRLALYKYEPFILHVKCRDFAVASQTIQHGHELWFQGKWYRVYTLLPFESISN